jgi:hypothetical protein
VISAECQTHLPTLETSPFVAQYSVAVCRGARKSWMTFFAICNAPWKIPIDLEVQSFLLNGHCAPPYHNCISAAFRYCFLARSPQCRVCLRYNLPLNSALSYSLQIGGNYPPELSELEDIDCAQCKIDSTRHPTWTIPIPHDVSCFIHAARDTQRLQHSATT